MELEPKQFDRELTLRELLAALPAAKLQAGLAALFGNEYRLMTGAGHVVIGALQAPASSRVPIRHDLESIGYLETSTAEPEKLKAAVSFIELLLLSAARYYMASALHIEAIHADYEALKKAHASLAESEKRYRDLAASLEIKVREQVAIIDTAHRQLYQAEKMASVGQLAAGVAHEINNPIGFIKSNLNTADNYLKQLIQHAASMQTDPDSAAARIWRGIDGDFILSDFADLVTESTAGADRIARIVTDLKDFSNVDHAEVQLVDINDNIKSVCNMAAPEIGKAADLRLELGELPKQTCAPGRVNQAILNVLLNAGQAMQRRGMITIRSEFKDGASLVHVEDDGCGIPPEILPRVFDPFFTTREVGQGTGLGLTVARDTAVAHGGDISIRSLPGEGTVVTIRLPVR